MNSITQLVLGAGVGVAFLGPRIGACQAAMLGGALGSVPDLDVFYPFETPVDSFILHRGATHSLIIHAVATPVFGEAVLRMFRRFREEGADAHRLRVYAAVYLIFATHALLDAMTVYGTRLFWPIWQEPIGIGSIFIVDPLFTLPLLALAIGALFVRAWGPRIAKAAAAALIVSTGYLGWTLGAQQLTAVRAETAIGDSVDGDQVLAIPTPFNALLWRVIVLRGDDYLNVYVPILGGAEQITAYRRPSNHLSLSCALENDELRHLHDFADGFVRFERLADRSIASADLRMGLTPNYVFRYAAPLDGLSPAGRIQGERSAEGDWDWFGAGLLGEGIDRPIEAVAKLNLDDGPTQIAGASDSRC